MIEIPGRIPIAIHPLFWVFASFIGWINSQNLIGTVIWLGIILVSVLLHEFGHALTAVLFKQKARIQLIALGGVTTYDGPKLSFWKQFLITLNGPLFGFFLFLIAASLLPVAGPKNSIFFLIVRWTLIANLFWTIVNLIPVLPLDGGQLLRIVLEGAFGVKGFKASLFASGLIAALMALYFFMIQQLLIGAFFFLFAFQGFDMWRKSRFATRTDREEENKQLMMQAEILLQQERIEEAKVLLKQVQEKGGMLAVNAAQYLAIFAAKEGKRQEAYDLLLPIKDQITDDSLVLLHELAAEHKNYAFVCQMAKEAFQISQTQQTALRNARAFAYQKKGKPAGGWLQTAWQFGGLNLTAVLQEESFMMLRFDPDFRSFVEKLQ